MSEDGPKVGCRADWYFPIMTTEPPQTRRSFGRYGGQGFAWVSDARRQG